MRKTCRINIKERGIKILIFLTRCGSVVVKVVDANMTFVDDENSSGNSVSKRAKHTNLKSHEHLKKNTGNGNGKCKDLAENNKM